MEMLGFLELPGWLVAIIVFIAIVCIYTWYKQTLFSRHGIKQKPTTFLLGDLAGFATKGPLYLNADTIKDHGKVFGHYIGNVGSLIVADTEMIKQITLKEFNKFPERFNIISSNTKSILKGSLSRAEGERWRYLRSTFSPAFSSGKLRHMSPYIHNCLANFLEILEEKRQVQGEGFDIAPVFHGYTMDVICNTGFGIDINSQRDPDNPYIKHANSLLERDAIKNLFIMLFLIFPDLAKLDLPMDSILLPQEIFTFFQTATHAAFEERKNNLSTHRDLLQLMINATKSADTDQKRDGRDGEMTFGDNKSRGLTDEEVLLNSILFMVAGYETTSTTLSWLCYRLAINPYIQDKLVSEIDEVIGQDEPTYDNAFKLRYLDMVVNETLRMHPPATIINRLAVEDVNICGINFKKGWSCTIPILALHFMPEYWDEPTEFNPERFAPENRSNINQYAYLPFGNGPRNCIGMRQALLEVKMTVIGLLQTFRVVKSPNLTVPMTTTRQGLNKPAEPIFVKLEPKK